MMHARASAMSIMAGLLVVGAVPAQPASKRPPCPDGMVEIDGDYCPSVEQTCLAWLPIDEKGAPPRCAEFAPSGACATRMVAKHFCIDKHEFPNEAGRKPVVMKSWAQAQEICRWHGKRLCTDSEWTLACEGPQHLPYPYGTKRDANACNIDKHHLDVDEKALRDPSTRGAEVARLWQGEPSGARSTCTSPYGVVDLTGNVDEWVVNETGRPHKSGLKGGYWGRVRNACRPMTTAHGETFPFYQTGFRCCSDAATSKAATVVSSK